MLCVRREEVEKVLNCSVKSSRFPESPSTECVCWRSGVGEVVENLLLLGGLRKVAGVYVEFFIAVPG